MTDRQSRHVRAAVIALAIATVPASLPAQRRVTLSPGLALGAAFDGSRGAGSTWIRGRHALLTLDVETAGIPVRLRVEAMAVALSQSHGPVSLGTSIVLPFGRGNVRPYAVTGGGVYGVGGVGHPFGWSAGAGAEYHRRAATLFAEARLHTQTASAVSFGLRF